MAGLSIGIWFLAGLSLFALYAVDRSIKQMKEEDRIKAERKAKAEAEAK